MAKQQKAEQETAEVVDDDLHPGATEDEQAQLPLGDDEEDSSSEAEEQAVEEPAPPSFREVASQYGFDLSSFEDDAAAAKHLQDQIAAAQQHSELATYGQEFVRHAADGSWQQYQQWKAEQAKASQQAAEPKLWDPPEWNPTWTSLLKQDEHGNIVPDASKGGTPEHVAKFNRYLAYRQEQQERFWADPYKFFEPYVARAAEEKAKAIVEDRLSKFGSELDAKHFVMSNDWLWEDKAAKKLSDEGKFFVERFKEIDADQDLAGLSQRGKEKLALKELESYRRQKASAAPTAEDKKIETLKKAAGFTPSSGGSTSRTNAKNGAPLAQDETASFAEMLAADLAAAGFEPGQVLVEA